MLVEKLEKENLSEEKLTEEKLTEEKLTEEKLVEEKPIEEKLVQYLADNNMKISTAESCTGGMISSTLVNVPGASAVLDEAYVTYANQAKIKILSVKKETLEKFGAVSYETAYEMVEGLQKLTNADVAVAVTGIAGPDGGSKDKPVGTVYAGFYYNNTIEVKLYHFHGDRFSVRSQTVETVLDNIYKNITNL